LLHLVGWFIWIIKIQSSLKSGNNATETSKTWQTAYVNNALSKTKYYNGLVLNQEGIKMTPLQSTENDFQPTTGGHSTKFIFKILLKGTRNDGKWIKCTLWTGNYHTWVREKSVQSLCPHNMCNKEKLRLYAWGNILREIINIYCFICQCFYYISLSLFSCFNVYSAKQKNLVGNKIRISWQKQCYNIQVNTYVPLQSCSRKYKLATLHTLSPCCTSVKHKFHSFRVMVRWVKCKPSTMGENKILSGVLRYRLHRTES